MKAETRILEKIDKARRSNTYDIKNVMQEIEEMRLSLEKLSIGRVSSEVNEF